MDFDIPILLIAWRRPEATKQVIQALRLIRPKHLFVACDGPNHERINEAEKVAATRALIESSIDWTCQIKKLYSDTNQGCRLAVSSAITWFFDQVEEGIILEDDCLPLPSFFEYCRTLLERYRTDTRVWCISGSNFQDGQWRGDGSYYFSQYNHCWGWASWRRCWKHYDNDLRSWHILKGTDWLINLFPDQVERNYWSAIWQRLADHELPDTWDYQWTLTCMVNGGLTALPNYNLVNNIGFDNAATHMTRRQNKTALTRNLDHFDAPSFVLRDARADRYSFDHWFGGRWMRQPWSLIRKPLRLLTQWKSSQLQ